MIAPTQLNFEYKLNSKQYCMRHETVNNALHNNTNILCIMENDKQEKKCNGNLKNETRKQVPSWLTEEVFEDFLRNDVKNFAAILDFNVEQAVKNGENYMTVMLRVRIEVRLTDGNSREISYMVKTMPSSEKMQSLVKEWKVFEKEFNTYTKLIPVFESLYEQAGKSMRFAPKILNSDRTTGNDRAIILEDLRLKGFQNANRLQGFDEAHTKAVLDKLAQLHAVSAYYYSTRAPYPELYDRCLNSDGDSFEGHRNNVSRIFIESLGLYGNFEYFKKKLEHFTQHVADPFQAKSPKDPNEFNALNHGDCWANNIMFRYDADGNLEETLFVDFQMSRYGPPAQDLFYFLLSSTSLEIKLKQFEYFIYYYHAQLKDYLELLKYPGKIPSLRDLHISLFKHSDWVYTAAIILLPVVVLESNDDSSVDNLLDPESDRMKRAMYTNKRFADNMSQLLPWLEHRGYFDI